MRSTPIKGSVSKKRAPTTLYVQLGFSNGNITCDPAVLHAIHKDHIVFQYDGENPFAIQAKGLSPLDAAEIRSERFPAGANVLDGVQRGTYSFACAIYAEGQIYIDASCPSIIIE